MRFHISYGVLVVALGAVPAQAQTVITGPVVEQPAVAAALPDVVQPAETVRTTRTVHTVRRLVPVRERIVTTRTVTRSVMPAAPVFASAVSFGCHRGIAWTAMLVVGSITRIRSGSYT